MMHIDGPAGLLKPPHLNRSHKADGHSGPVMQTAYTNSKAFLNLANFETPNKAP
jgi:hypothetical protein